MQTRILTQKDLNQVLTMEMAVAAVEAAFAADGRGESMMPSKVYLSLDAYHGDFRAMPAYLNGAAGLKWVNVHPNNPRDYKLPSVMALYILSDPKTALPLAVMDGTLLTAARTGAAAAVASKYLAPSKPKTLGLVGCGVQAHYFLRAHQVLFGQMDVLCADVSADTAQLFAKETGGRVATLAEAVACDIVCTGTPVREPIVKQAWIKGATHINAMGADAPGKQELEASILKMGRLFVDGIKQASGSGEINVPLKTGALKPEDIFATLGEVIAGKKPGREADEVTVFDSTGLAIQDVALAQALFEAASKKGLGQTVDFLNG